MIKNILVPEKIGSYYLFAKRIVGFEITSSHVFATASFLRGQNKTIEQCFSSFIEQNNGETLADRTALAIKKILKQIGKYDEIHTTLSSSNVIFKSLRLPFNDVEKIKKVVDFEVEPLLPFSIADAVVDFIITKQITEQSSAEVLIAAVQKQYIVEQLELFSLAGVHPSTITVDILDVYSFYHQIPSYSHLKENVVLIEINHKITKVASITYGQLQFIRTVNTGIEHIVQKLSSELSTSPNNAYEQLKRYGFNYTDETYQKSIQAASNSLAKQLRFTLQSFKAQLKTTSEETHIYLFGNGAQIEGIQDWISHELKEPTALFEPNLIEEDKHITLKNMAIPVANTVSTAASLPTDITGHFNLLQKEFTPSSEQTLLKQVVLGGVLALSLFGGILLNSFLQVRTLRVELESSKAESADVLTEWFPDIDKGPIDDMLDEAKEETTKEEKLWFSFARSAHNSFLNLLLELTRLDRESLGLIIEKITIDQDRGIMMFKAQVKDHEALVHLENELRQSDLFSYVQPQDNPNFNMELRFADEQQGEI